MKTAMATGIYCLGLALWLPLLGAADGGILNLTANSPVVGSFEKFELSFRLAGEPANPYDPAQADVYVLFHSPSGRETRANAFPYQDFFAAATEDNLEAQGQPMWKCRFSPSEAGAWTYQVMAAGPQGHKEAQGSFEVKPSANPGFIHLSKRNPRYFERDNGKTWFSIGQNMGWGGPQRMADYGRWLPKVAANGGNTVRIWMAPWSFAVEWQDSGLGNYAKRQKEAWQLDSILSYCEKHQMAVLLCLINHGSFSTSVNPNWPENPYNAALGGPLKRPEEIWTNPAAQAYLARRWRYITARWAYSPALLGWELWNEMEWTDHFWEHSAQAAAWHQQQAALLRSLDPHHHLISTSLADLPADPVLFQSMDFVQVHHYGTRDMAAMARGYARSVQAQMAKPFFLGEFGIDAGSPASDLDPHGLSLHDCQWASLMSQCGGGGLSWYWDNYIDPQDLYATYRGLAGFLAGEDLAGESYQPMSLRVVSKETGDLRLSPGVAQWGRKAGAASFRLLASGDWKPLDTNLTAYQYGQVNHADLRNPPSFQVDYPRQGDFAVNISEASDEGARVGLLVDGRLMANRNLAAGGQETEVSVPLEAGRHVIKVDSQGKDWFKVSLFRFGNMAAPLRCFALVGPRKVLGWVQHRNHTYWGLHQGWPLKAVSDAGIELEGLAAGNWQVQWWDTEKGSLRQSASLQCGGGRCIITVPSVDSDLAFKLIYLGRNSSLKKP